MLYQSQNNYVCNYKYKAIGKANVKATNIQYTNATIKHVSNLQQDGCYKLVVNLC